MIQQRSFSYLSKKIEGYWWIYFKLVFILLIINMIETNISNILKYFFYKGLEINGETYLTEVYDILILFLTFIFKYPLYIGIILLILNIFNRRNPQLNNLMFGLNEYGKYFKIGFTTALYTIPWFLLLIIPGYIKSLEYFFSIFIIIENPDKDIKEALSESQEMMKGKMWKLFLIFLKYLVIIFLLFLSIILPNFYFDFGFFSFDIEDINNDFSFISLLPNIIIFLIGITSIVALFFAFIFTEVTDFYYQVKEEYFRKIKAIENIE